MNDLETLQGLEKLETLIRDGIERGEHLVQQACRVDEIAQLLQEMQEQRASLHATSEQAGLLSSHILDLEPVIALVQHNVQTLERQYHTLTTQAEALDQNIQDISAQVAEINQSAQEYKRVIQQLAGLTTQLKQEQSARLANHHAIQQVRTELVKLSRISDTNNSNLRQLQSEQARLIKELETQIAAQADQITIVGVQLASLSNGEIESRLKSLETLPQDIAQLRSHVQAVETSLREDSDVSHKHLAHRYQILVVLSAIAAAGLAVLGQWYINRGEKQPLPTSQSQISRPINQQIFR